MSSTPDSILKAHLLLCACKSTQLESESVTTSEQFPRYAVLRKLSVANSSKPSMEDAEDIDIQTSILR